MKVDMAKTIPDAWVVFSNQSDIPWLRLLKPGFRHCFLLLHDGERWISFDPLSHYTDIQVHSLPGHFDLPLWFQDRGHIVVPARQSRVKKQAPFGVFTCVEAVKRTLGIHKRWVITPWQLFNHLGKEAGLAPMNTGKKNFFAEKLFFLKSQHKGDIAWEV